MPRIGTTPAEQTSGGLFGFPEGRGEIVAASVYNHLIPGYPPTKCGYKLMIQRLDHNWNPTNDDPVEEFLPFGSVDKFHPGRAASSDDHSTELEIGMSGDCGIDDGVEGTCVIAVGNGPDKKAKAVVFSNSFIQAGGRVELLNGYAPNLVGLKCTFTQLMMEKGAGYTGSKDPTCLIVGVGGKVAGAEVRQWPGASAPAPGPVAVKQPAGKAGAPRAAAATAGTGTGSGPVNGAVVQANGPAAASTPVSVSSPTDPDLIESIALQVLTAGTGAGPLPGDIITLHSSTAGQTLSRAKIGAKMVTLCAKNHIPTTQHKPVRALFDGDWFVERAAELGWGVDAASGMVTIPAE